MKRKARSTVALVKDITIDKAVPIPGKKGHTGGPVINAFRAMKIRDSFFYPGPRAMTNMYARARKVGIEITMRSVTENGMAGVRIWRTA